MAYSSVFYFTKMDYRLVSFAASTQDLNSKLFTICYVFTHFLEESDSVPKRFVSCEKASSVSTVNEGRRMFIVLAIAF